MELTAANLAAMFTSFEASFTELLKAPTPIFYDKVATQIASSTSSNTFYWAAKIPVMRQWLDERQVNNLATYSYQLSNLDYELTDELDRDVVLDDQYGLYTQINLPMMANAVKKQPDYLLVNLLQNGHQLSSIGLPAIYDGQNFFDTAHPVTPKPGQGGGSGTQSNYASSGKALTWENFRDVRSTMMGFLGEDGKPYGITPNLLVVPPALEVTARSIVNSAFYSPQSLNVSNVVAPQTNVLQGICDILVVPELAGQDTTWYLLDTTKPLKPFLFQLRQAPVFTSLISPSDPKVFWHKKFTFGVDMRCAAGLTLWPLAYKAVA